MRYTELLQSPTLGLSLGQHITPTKVTADSYTNRMSTAINFDYNWLSGMA